MTPERGRLSSCAVAAAGTVGAYKSLETKLSLCKEHPGMKGCCAKMWGPYDSFSPHIALMSSSLHNHTANDGAYTSKRNILFLFRRPGCRLQEWGNPVEELAGAGAPDFCV